MPAAIFLVTTIARAKRARLPFLSDFAAKHWHEGAKLPIR
jgi:hypothetical protein